MTKTMITGVAALAAAFAFASPANAAAGLCPKPGTMNLANAPTMPKGVTDTIIGSVRKTHRAVVVDEAWRTGSLAGEISAQIVENAFFELDAPIARVCSAEVPMPYAKHLEQAALPQTDKIVAAVNNLFGEAS